jgi:hypothetical protein
MIINPQKTNKTQNQQLQIIQIISALIINQNIINNSQDIIII